MDWSKAWQVVPLGQLGAARLQIGRQVPPPAPASVCVGTTQLAPAAQPAQPGSPLQPEFCVQGDPTAPNPGQAQSVDSSA